MADDLGKTDISLYGNKLVSTPHIDQIGKDGVIFTEGYISSPVCSPSRAGLLTGRYQQRFGHELQMAHRYVRNFAERWVFKLLPAFRPLTPVKLHGRPTDEDRMRQGLPPSEITLAEVLKAHGYHTGIVGKWHLGAADFALPCHRGFDFQYGFSEAFTLFANPKDTDIVNRPIKGQFMDKHQWRQGRNGNCCITRNCTSKEEVEAYLTDKLTDEAMGFIKQAEEKPFFLYLPYNAPHAPLQAKKSYVEQFAHVEDKTKQVYYAMIKNLDDEVGRLMDFLKENKLDSNTIVFFLSDNGGASYNGSTDNLPYRGGKMTNFEGGLKVPFMMRWKGGMEAGQICNSPVISLDIFTTVAQAVGCELPKDRVYDGKDLVKGTASLVPIHESLCWRSAENKAIRKGKWKLIINGISNHQALFDLSKDIGEAHNLYSQHPEVVKDLLHDLSNWESQMGKPLWPRMVDFIYKDAVHGELRFGF